MREIELAKKTEKEKEKERMKGIASKRNELKETLFDKLWQSSTA